jgi:hypothetical protein
LLQDFALITARSSCTVCSDGRKAVQGGVRVKLPEGMTWDSLMQVSPDEIRQKDVLPRGFLPLPHVKQATGGQVSPLNEIKGNPASGGPRPAMLRRGFDLPDCFTPEFPPPIFLTTDSAG